MAQGSRHPKDLPNITAHSIRTINVPLTQKARDILRTQSPVPTKKTDIHYIPQDQDHPRVLQAPGTVPHHKSRPSNTRDRTSHAPPCTSRSLGSSHGTSSSPSSTTWEPSPRSPHLPQPKYTRGARNPTLPNGQAAVISDSPASNPKIIYGTWKFISYGFKVYVRVCSIAHCNILPKPHPLSTQR